MTVVIKQMGKSSLFVKNYTAKLRDPLTVTSHSPKNKTMERDRGFNFKLLVPPRVNLGQVSDVGRQKAVEKIGDNMKTQERGYGVCFDKEQNKPLSSASVASLTKQTRQELPKMKAVPPVEKNEFEKIKCWKVRADSDTMQMEMQLQENKKTIETQRKAIQELQFANESLSMKLDEQISENEDLRNRDNATRNLCSILKDTFQQSAEKMHLFESEREETQHLLIENNERIQKLVSAFESLQIQVETDQQEMQKVKESLLQFDEIKEKICEEYKTKEEEVAVLQSELVTKENELQKTVFELQKTQAHSELLQLETDQQHKLLKQKESERETLLQKLQIAEQLHQETQKKCDASVAALEINKVEYSQILQSRELSLKELNKSRNEQAEKQKQLQTKIEELKGSLALERERATGLEGEVSAKDKDLQRKNILLSEMLEQSTKKDEQIRVLQNDLDTKSKSIKSLEGRIHETEFKVKELRAELLSRTEEVQLFKNEAEQALVEKGLLKKDCEAAAKAHEELKERFADTEIKVQDLEAQLLSEREKNKEHMEQQNKEISIEKERYGQLLTSFNDLQSEKIAIQQKYESERTACNDTGANIKATEERAENLTRENEKLQEKNQILRETVDYIKTNIQDKCQKTETLQKKFEENCEHLQEKITAKEKQLTNVETKLNNLRKKIEDKLKAQKEYQKENTILKKQLSKEGVKSSHLETVVNSLQDETQSMKRMYEEKHQKLLNEYEKKANFASELENEMLKLRITAADAVKDKEDTELKCQQKISDMVTLMEKHKSQCDRMVEEKEAELEAFRKREMETVARINSMELDLLKHQQLKKQLKIERTKTENLQKQLTDLKKEMSAMKKSGGRNKQSPDQQFREGKHPQSQKESNLKRHMFDFSAARKPAPYSKDGGSVSDMKNMDTDSNVASTPNLTCSFRNSKIKSYRVITPPSDATVAPWLKTIIDLDPKSDNSELNDLLIQSPVHHKSPGNFLKLAAIKRMRDAGWTAVTGCDKKKKKNEKIFA
ncbi:synaptonemal complex protein 1 isoform X2 [Cynoglossus semilaevis]|uniref:synaptonemal complex protein 1 isoform X2 n=1 Tax=Cynoglossus semilaevis TaxID=244447 RepID=UPI0007DC8BE8|nr:synaptonemal complex protein 1 isoform X2 [Cynoglossus semilaevis]